MQNCSIQTYLRFTTLSLRVVIFQTAVVIFQETVVIFQNCSETHVDFPKALWFSKRRASTGAPTRLISETATGNDLKVLI
jgi:hypothetical protein